MSQWRRRCNRRRRHVDSVPKSWGASLPADYATWAKPTMAAGEMAAVHNAHSHSGCSAVIPSKAFWSRPGYKNATLSKMPSGQARSNTAAAKGETVCNRTKRGEKPPLLYEKKELLLKCTEFSCDFERSLRVFKTRGKKKRWKGKKNERDRLLQHFRSLTSTY